MELAKIPDLGEGPWSVKHCEEDGFYYLLLNGERPDHLTPYPLAKTAYRACRRYNEEHAAAAQRGAAFRVPGIVVGLDLRGTKEEVLARYPDPLAPPLQTR